MSIAPAGGPRRERRPLVGCEPSGSGGGQPPERLTGGRVERAVQPVAARRRPVLDAPEPEFVTENDGECRAFAADPLPEFVEREAVGCLSLPAAASRERVRAAASCAFGGTG